MVSKTSEGDSTRVRRATGKGSGMMIRRAEALLPHFLFLSSLLVMKVTISISHK